jgi:hypothetical protein
LFKRYKFDIHIFVDLQVIYLLISSRSLINPNKLFKILRIRYNFPPPIIAYDGGKYFKKFLKEELLPIRSFITQLFLIWITEFYYDIDEIIFKKILSFTKLMFLTKGESYSKVILQNLSNIQSNLSKLKKNQTYINSKYNLIPKSIIPNKILNIFSFNEIELSRQISLFESKIFKVY